MCCHGTQAKDHSNYKEGAATENAWTAEGVDEVGSGGVDIAHDLGKGMLVE